MTGWVDIGRAMPWLGPEPYWVSRDDAAPLRAELRGLGFKVFETGGEAVTNEMEFLAELVRTFDLPPYACLNWNAFVDALGDLVRSTVEPIALIWMDPAPSFIPDLSRGLRLYSALASILSEWNRLGKDCHQVILVLEGERSFLQAAETG